QMPKYQVLHFPHPAILGGSLEVRLERRSSTGPNTHQGVTAVLPGVWIPRTHPLAILNQLSNATNTAPFFSPPGWIETFSFSCVPTTAASIWWRSTIGSTPKTWQPYR